MLQTFQALFSRPAAFDPYVNQSLPAILRRNMFTCEICGKNFNTKSNFTRHVSIHEDTGKEQNCSTCHKSFVNNRGLKNHQKTVRSVPEKLDLLEKIDRTQSSLCSVCGKVVANIERHLETHSEDHFKCI